MSTSALEHEDLDNIPLVRMEDVQPSRDRQCEVSKSKRPREDLEISVVDYDDNCIVDSGDDSNIGSMVSIQSDGNEDSLDTELIIPDMLDDPLDEVPIEIAEKEIKPNPPNQDSWPTLEILPGGVIKHADKYEDDLTLPSPQPEPGPENSDMMYACAKCSQSFRYLFCLVKHVKWHEDEQKKQKGPHLAKLTGRNKKYICVNSGKVKVISKTNRRKVPKKKKPCNEQ